MKKFAFCSAIAALSLATSAFAADAPKTEEKKPETKVEAKAEHKMEMPKPGEEAKKLAPFYTHGGAYTGTVVAGAMGPDSKEMKTHGKVNCTALFGGFGYSCDIEDKMGEMTWKGHMVTVWDTLSKSYKGSGVDNFGTFTTWAGTMSDDGKKFSLTSNEDLNMGPNTPSYKDRLTWDMSSGKMVFTEEHQINGEWKPWMTAEMGGKAAPATEKKTTSGTDKKS